MGFSKSQADDLAARISPDGVSLLKADFKKLPSGDVVPSTWSVSARGTPLPPQYKETIDYDILLVNDGKLKSGHITGPEYDVFIRGTGFKWIKKKGYEGVAERSYFQLPWVSSNPELQNAKLWAPKGYNVKEDTRTVYSNGWSFSTQKGRYIPPGMKLWSSDTMAKSILVPESDSFSFVPTNAQLMAIKKSLS